MTNGWHNLPAEEEENTVTLYMRFQYYSQHAKTNSRIFFSLFFIERKKTSTIVPSKTKTHHYLPPAPSNLQPSQIRPKEKTPPRSGIRVYPKSGTKNPLVHSTSSVPQRRHATRCMLDRISLELSCESVFGVVARRSSGLGQLSVRGLEVCA